MIELNVMDIVKIAISVTVGSFAGTEIAFWQFSRKTGIDFNEVSNTFSEANKFLKSKEAEILSERAVKLILYAEEYMENFEGSPLEKMLKGGAKSG